MTDEQIKAWRKEYFDLTGEMSARSDKWKGFLLAKQSQKPVKLPEFYQMDDICGYDFDEIRAALEAANIPYEQE